MKTTNYGKTDSAIFTIEGFRTPMCIFFHAFSWGARASVEYRYDTDNNTIKHREFAYISRKEFYTRLKEIEANIEGKIFVKRTWL